MSSSEDSLAVVIPKKPDTEKKGFFSFFSGGGESKDGKAPFFKPWGWKKTFDSYDDKFNAEMAFNDLLGLLTDIADSKDKTLVMMFGESQDGKSTTINAEIHGRYGRIERIKEETKVVIEFGEEVKQVQRIRHAELCLEHVVQGIEVAKTGQPNVGMSCTRWPKSYSLPSVPDHVLLDTRGIGDARETPEEDAVAAILTDMCVRSAKDVKLVVVQRFSNLEGGMVKLATTGMSLARIVRGFEVPALFLFNRYPANTVDGTGINYVYSQWIEKRYPKGVFPDKIVPVVMNEEQKAELRDTEERLQQGIVGQIRAKTEGVIIAKCEEMGLKYSSGETGVDIDLAVQAAKIDKKGLKYLSVLNESLKRGFVSYFAPESQYSIDRLLTGISKLKPIPKERLVYSSTNKHVQAVKEVFDAHITKYRGILDAAAFVKRFNSSVIDSVLILVDGEQKELEEQKRECKDKAKVINPEIGSKGLAEMAEHMKKRILSTQEDISSAKAAKKKIMDDTTPKFLTRDIGHEESWRGSHECKYSGEIPIVHVKEHKWGEYTERTVKSEEPEDFCVIYSWGSFWTGVRRVFGWLDFLKLMDHVFGEWNVEFYCLPKDHPRTKDEIRRYEQDIARKEKELEKMNVMLSDMEKISSREGELEYQIQTLEEVKRKLVLFKLFISRVNELFGQEEERIKQCYKLCRMWNPEEVDCSVFLRSYDHYHQTVPESDPHVVDTELLFSSQGKFEEDLNWLLRAFDFDQSSDQ